MFKRLWTRLPARTLRPDRQRSRYRKCRSTTQRSDEAGTSPVIRRQRIPWRLPFGAPPDPGAEGSRRSIRHRRRVSLTCSTRSIPTCCGIWQSSGRTRSGAPTDLHPDAARLPLPRRHHGLSEPQGAGLAAVEHDGGRLLRRGAGGGDSPLRRARHLQHRPRQTAGSILSTTSRRNSDPESTLTRPPNCLTSWLHL